MNKTYTLILCFVISLCSVCAQGTNTANDNTNQNSQTQTKHSVSLDLTGLAYPELVKLEGLDEEGKVIDGSKVHLKINLEKEQYTIEYIKINNEVLEGDFFEERNFEKEFTITKDTTIEVSLFLAPYIQVFGAYDDTQTYPVKNGTITYEGTRPYSFDYYGTTFTYNFIRPNTALKITATPDEGYEIDKILLLELVDGSTFREVGDIKDDLIVNVRSGVREENINKESYVLLATFRKAPQKLSVKLLNPEIDGGTVEVVGGPLFYKNTEVLLRIQRKLNHKLVALIINGERHEFEGNKFRFTITKDTQIKPVFARKDNPLPVQAIESSSSKIKTYPNPTRDWVKVEGLVPNTQVNLISISGSRLKSLYSDVTGKVSFDLRQLPKGTYIIQAGKHNSILQIH